MTATDPTYAGLLAGVLAAPEDDVPRGVLADWWEENGREVECPACRGGRYCPKCSGEGCSGHSVAANGPCLVYDCRTCHRSGRASDGRRERAEFVRVQVQLADVVKVCPCFQCAKARGSSCCEPSACICKSLRQRERELLKRHGQDWIRGLPPGECVAE